MITTFGLAKGMYSDQIIVKLTMEDLINIGAYKKGSNKNIDYALEKIDAVNDYLMQGVNEKFTFEDEVKMLCDIFEEE
jgi:flagellum-specific ATP synthase